MRAGQRSRTAEATAAMRAVHRVVDDDPRVFDDPFAAALAGLTGWAQAGTLGLDRRRADRLSRRLPLFLRSRPPIGSRRIRAQIVVRSRFAEERLVEAVQASGVDQYVILAAGLDSFGLRIPPEAGDLRVFEVDHPETQRWKSSRLRSLGLQLPERVELVPVDFRSQSLAQGLSESGLDPTRPAFVSWLGVTYYLGREALTQTLETVGRWAPGTELVLDYWTSTSLLWPADRALLSAIRLAVRAQGEPMLSFFAAQSMSRLVRQSGFDPVEDMDARTATECYLSRRRDGLLMPGFSRLLHCRVPIHRALR